MDKPRRTIYKAKYVIEIEVAEENRGDSTGNQHIGSFPKITAYPAEVVARDLESVFYKGGSKIFEHIEKHFPDEARYLYAQMYDLEDMRPVNYSPVIALGLTQLNRYLIKIKNESAKSNRRRLH